MFKNYVFVDYEKKEYNKDNKIIKQGIIKKMIINENGFIEIDENKVKKNKVTKNKDILHINERNYIIKDNFLVKFRYDSHIYKFDFIDVIDNWDYINSSKYKLTKQIIKTYKFNQYLESNLYKENIFEIYNLKIISIIGKKIKLNVFVERNKKFYHNIGDILIFH